MPYTFAPGLALAPATMYLALITADGWDAPPMFQFDVGHYIANLGMTSEAILARSTYDDGFYVDNGSVQTNRDAAMAFDLSHATVATPEPASMLLLGTGLVGLGAWRYRRRS